MFALINGNKQFGVLSAARTVWIEGPSSCMYKSLCRMPHHEGHVTHQVSLRVAERWGDEADLGEWKLSPTRRGLPSESTPYR